MGSQNPHKELKPTNPAAPAGGIYPTSPSSDKDSPSADELLCSPAQMWPRQEQVPTVLLTVQVEEQNLNRSGKNSSISPA